MNETAAKQPFMQDTVRLYQAYNITRQIVVILGSILLAKSVMSLNEIGNFETLLYLGQFMSIFWVNGLNQAFLTTYPKVITEQKNDFVSSVFLLFLLISFAFSFILVVGKRLILPFLIDQNYIEGLYWFALYSFANVPAILIPSILLLKDNAKELIRFTLFYFVGYLLVFILNYITGANLINLLVLLNVFAFALLIVSVRLSFRPDFKLISRKWIKRFLLIGSPLIGYSILAGLAPLFDNWLVQQLYDDKSLFAIYRYGAREFPITMTLAVGLSTSLLPAVSSNLGKGLNQLKVRSTRLYPVVAISSAILIIISKYAFPVIFNPSFAASAPIFNIYILVIITRMVYPQTIILAIKKTRVLLYISIIELGINIISSIMLGLKYGLIGIAIGTLIAFSIEKILQAFYLRFRHDIRLSQYTDIKQFIIYSSFLLIVYFVFGL